jgi:hypothetical protein
MSQTPPPTPLAIPVPPRSITAIARRRSWAEMPVRLWCVLAIILAIVIVYFTVNQVMSGASERDMILHGIPVDAVLVQVSGSSNPESSFHRRETLAAKVRYTLPDEQVERLVPGSLSILNPPDDVVHPGDRIPLRIDRADPKHWTDRTQPRSWLVELSVVMLLFPLLAILLIIAGLQQARVLRIWRQGEIAEATVVEVRQTALAPLSRLLRFTLNDGSNSRICSLLVPTRAGIPSVGETISIVMPRGVPQRAILATLYL